MKYNEHRIKIGGYLWKIETKYHQGKFNNLKTLAPLFRSTKEAILVGYKNSQNKRTRNLWIIEIIISPLQSFVMKSKCKMKHNKLRIGIGGYLWNKIKMKITKVRSTTSNPNNIVHVYVISYVGWLQQCLDS